MKLHSDNLQNRIEELEQISSEQTSKNRALNEMIKNRTLIDNSSELEHYKKEIIHLNKVISANEESIRKIPDLEKRIKNLKIKYDKDIKILEENNKILLKKCEDTQKDKLSRWNIEDDLDTVNVNINFIQV